MNKYILTGSVQVRPLNMDGSLNLLGLETVRLIYFRNKTAGNGTVSNSVKCKNYSSRWV